MKLKIDCHKCSALINVELTNKRILSEKCDSQHTNLIIIQNHLYELLFDLGCLAFLDGYYREAIFNFNLALERFREFLIKFYLVKEKIPQDLISQMWTGMAAQSERQLGAYQALYILFNKKVVDKQSYDTALRNKIVHKGEMPDETEANKFGELVFEHIKNSCSDIESEDFLEYTLHTLVMEDAAFLKNNTHPTITISFPGFQITHNKNFSNYSFKEKLIAIEKNKSGIFNFSSVDCQVDSRASSLKNESGEESITRGNQAP